MSCLLRRQQAALLLTFWSPRTLLSLSNAVRILQRWRSDVAVGRWTCYQMFMGLIPTEAKLRNNLGQVVHTYVLLS